MSFSVFWSKNFEKIDIFKLGKMVPICHWERVRLHWECLRFPEAETVLKNPWSVKPSNLISFCDHQYAVFTDILSQNRHWENISLACIYFKSIELLQKSQLFCIFSQMVDFQCLVCLDRYPYWVLFQSYFGWGLPGADFKNLSKLCSRKIHADVWWCTYVGIVWCNKWYPGTTYFRHLPVSGSLGKF